ncbi:hypothetical protein NNA34_00480 [Lacticaseibacillus paracasei]|uniref:hypothetical protein n=1 Tax=Lacticaseibacillus paracasei TaxID=1597 RepID=UPI0028759054|nr:hypothetical protein [Lacticaseibacillus paracasei]MDS0488775.1 hypothetical protein [Lacticaseibacillus paracasei]
MTVSWYLEDFNDESNELNNDSDIDFSTFNQRTHNIQLKVKGGKGLLRFVNQQVWGTEGVSESVIFNGHKIADAFNKYASPTEEWIYKNYYVGDKITCHQRLSEYRHTIQGSRPLLKQILMSLVPFFDLLRDGIYLFTIRDLLPVNGNGDFFAIQRTGLIHDDATTESPIYDSTNSGTSFPLYLVPTQPTSMLNFKHIQQLEKSQTVGMGLTYEFYGFTNLLFDGHHRAAVAFSQKAVFPCVSIVPLSFANTDSADDIKFTPLEDFPEGEYVGKSKISDWHFLDYPTTYEIAMIIDYVAKSVKAPEEDRPVTIKMPISKGLSEEKVIWIIQGLFYTNEVDAYVRLEPLIRRFYPFEIIYRRYYSLLVNWLPQKHVQLLLMNFLIDNLSTDDELNKFVAIALAKIEE